MVRGSWQFVVIAAVGLVGCGKSSSGAGGSASTTTSTGSGVSAMKACTDLEHVVCTERDTCSMSGYLNNLDYGSEATCEARLSASCVAALGAKGTAQTPTNLESCVSAYGSTQCPDFLNNSPIPACAAPMGSVAVGGACGAAAQCASGFCLVSPLALCGQCAAVPTPGASCLSEAECGRDLACVKPAGATATTTGQCAAWVAQGAMCDDTAHPCGAGLQCVGQTVGMALSGTCQTAVTTVGMACDAARKTGPACNGVDGLACVGSKCVAITLVAGGQMCGLVGGGFTACQAGGLCKKALVTDKTGTCVAPAAEGAACDVDPSIGPPCLSPAKCVTSAPGATAGTCTLPDASKCM